MYDFHIWPLQKHQRSHAGNKRIISRGCHDRANYRTVVCHIQRRRPASPEPPAQLTPTNPRSWNSWDADSVVTSSRDRVWVLPANNNQRITWHRKVVQTREVDSFQTYRKSQDPEHGQLSANSLNGQESEHFRLNFNWRQKLMEYVRNSVS